MGAKKGGPAFSLVWVATGRGPRIGSPQGSRMRTLQASSCLACKAALYFMWLDFLKHQATAFGKQIAFVNLDETSIAVRFERKGAVARSSWWGGSAGPCRAKQPRGSATLICFSSPDEEIQRVLPPLLEIMQFSRSKPCGRLLQTSQRLVSFGERSPVGTMHPS